MPGYLPKQVRPYRNFVAKAERFFALSPSEVKYKINAPTTADIASIPAMKTMLFGTKWLALKDKQDQKKRIVHELLHISGGYPHSEMLRQRGYYSHPSRDRLSWRLKREIDAGVKRFRPERFDLPRLSYDNPEDENGNYFTFDIKVVRKTMAEMKKKGWDVSPIQDEIDQLQDVKKEVEIDRYDYETKAEYDDAKKEAIEEASQKVYDDIYAAIRDTKEFYEKGDGRRQIEQDRLSSQIEKERTAFNKLIYAKMKSIPIDDEERLSLLYIEEEEGNKRFDERSLELDKMENPYDKKKRVVKLPPHFEYYYEDEYAPIGFDHPYHRYSDFDSEAGSERLFRFPEQHGEHIAHKPSVNNPNSDDYIEQQGQFKPLRARKQKNEFDSGGFYFLPGGEWDNEERTKLANELRLKQIIRRWPEIEEGRQRGLNNPSGNIKTIVCGLAAIVIVKLLRGTPIL